jgi:hypothetical protein
MKKLPEQAKVRRKWLRLETFETHFGQNTFSGL